MGKYFFKNTDNKIFSKMLISSISSSIIYAIIGLILLIAPGLTTSLIGLAIGLIFLSSGLILILKYYKSKGAVIYKSNLFFGTLLGILGLLLILIPSLFTDFIRLGLGVYLIIQGANKAVLSTNLKLPGSSVWFLTFVMGLLYILLGVTVLLNSYSILEIAKLVGLFIVLSSVLDICNTFMLASLGDEFTNKFWRE